VGCLYCGKEIGAFRQIRDNEFCSDVHRKQYGARLGRALGKIAAPEPPPAPVAPFRFSWPLQTGKSDFLLADLIPHAHTTRISGDWPVTVPAAYGGQFHPARIHAVEPAAGRENVRPIARMRMPRFELAALGGITESDEPAAFVAPPFCDQWMPSAEAQPVERWIQSAVAEARPAAIPVRTPGAPPITRTFIRRSVEFADAPDAEPVAREVRALLDGTPASSWRGPSLIRFGLHAVEEISAPAATAVQAPPPAGQRPSLAPVPVESMPAVPAFVPAAIAPAATLEMPAIEALTAQVLPQARAVDRPAPVPVESFPTVAALVPAACNFRPALRFPTLARFQPAEDASEALAAPMIAPGPVPVEAMPSAAAFAPTAMPVTPRVVVSSFAPEIRVRFDVPKVAGPAPSVAEPPAPLPQPAMLEPLARIAAQPAGAQPERPIPAVPRPACFPLEYYCQRIASVPTKRVEPIETKVALVHQPFAVPAAHGPLEELLKVKPKRIVLPFEELFARKTNPGKRAGINTAGKIAAAVMVGIALWTGSRIANLSQHTENLRAEVAASERIVAVGESRDRNFGNGPMGKIRKAIADRAATEITDTFKAGMTAWGADKNSYAHGWKRDPKGYISTGEMALFQPSLQYTDYHMEFYGQIDEKSMGWVVRAQDKKNYYAMKFTIIEPGLRPIIAMVHYGVKNGKPGHKVQTPLSVMVHNQKPIHVAVDVRGNHFTTSIDGEPIESWTDDTLAQGGVGFFSETGERARLYWMKLSRNQDWLGRFCAYLSDGRSKQQTAEVWGPDIPNRIPGPIAPQAPALALAAAGPLKKKKRRSEAWI
jgi:hypothetical protein